ncbi:hypothetical protein EM6_0898 [Asticcacaulis excentricus]|uniref:Uncharacterized protein n=1 Tax=Asticcacaulis excentricus TaxID=78587 RepID=A0A3G9G7Q4_9CAUL|nr:hypothetical protein EM6_0898 [Asticcacaulis excentricus]
MIRPTFRDPVRATFVPVQLSTRRSCQKALTSVDHETSNMLNE